MQTIITILAIIGAVTVICSFCCLAAVMIFIIEDYIYTRRNRHESKTDNM